MARITARVPIDRPSDRCTVRALPSTSSAVTSRGGDQLGIELFGLPTGPFGELSPGQPVREAEVVLDARALTGLSAGGGALDEHGPEAFGRAVDRGGQTRGPAADDHQVVEVAGGRGRQPQCRGQLGVGGGDRAFHLCR